MFDKLLKTAATAACALAFATTAHAQTPTTPQIKYEKASEPPAIPAGLKVSCTKVPDDGYQASETCPVIHYDGYRTWIYSFIDNRVSFALVTYDSTGKVVRNTEVGGARYVFDALSSDREQTITIIGQAKQYVTVPWASLPH